jgi:hypothetical protein
MRCRLPPGAPPDPDVVEFLASHYKVDPPKISRDFQIVTPFLETQPHDAALPPLRPSVISTTANIWYGRCMYLGADCPALTQLALVGKVCVIPGSACGFPGHIRVCYSNLDRAKCQVHVPELPCWLRVTLRRGLLHA